MHNTTWLLCHKAIQTQYNINLTKTMGNRKRHCACGMLREDIQGWNINNKKKEIDCWVNSACLSLTLGNVLEIKLIILLPLQNTQTTLDEEQTGFTLSSTNQSMFGDVNILAVKTTETYIGFLKCFLARTCSRKFDIPVVRVSFQWVEGSDDNIFFKEKRRGHRGVWTSAVLVTNPQIDSFIAITATLYIYSGHHIFVSEICKSSAKRVNSEICAKHVKLEQNVWNWSKTCKIWANLQSWMAGAKMYGAKKIDAEFISNFSVVVSGTWRPFCLSACLSMSVCVDIQTKKNIYICGTL